MHNLQSIKLEAEKVGMKSRWTAEGLLVMEPGRMVHFQGENEQWVVYGIHREALEEEWMVSYILGGPPFYNTRDRKLAETTVSRLGLEIIEEP